MRSEAVTIDAIRSVRPLVARFADRTPLRRDHVLTAAIGAEVDLKLESLQPTGSFKIRGAAARLVGLEPDDRARGVITASTGNHGRAVAHVARGLGIPATVCLSEHVPEGKIALLAQLGCTLDIGGPSQDVAFDRAIAASEEPDGPLLVHSILDPVVLCGQGTCGIEIAEQAPEAAVVVVPVSGGGLISGISVAIKAMRPNARIVGVSMERGAVMHASLAAGHPVQLPEAVDTLADSLQGGIGLDNDTSFPIVQELVDEIVLVTEEEIALGMRHALREHRLVLEGAGAVGIAALLAGRIGSVGGPVVVVCSGANAELRTIADLAALEALGPQPPRLSTATIG